MKVFLLFAFCSYAAALTAYNEDLEKITLGKIEYDSRFHDLHLNFRDIDLNFPSKEWENFLKQLLISQKDDVHVVILNINPKNIPLYLAALHQGFKLYCGTEDSMELTYCLKNHHKDTCSFPPFHTVYTGITAVLANQEGEVLCVKERLGGETGWKAITGRVETESGELPIQAAIREVNEELGIQLTDGLLIGIQYTRDKKGKSPDINFIYLFEIEKGTKFSAQDSEIENIQWISAEFFRGKKIHDYPHISSLIIEHALQSKRTVYLAPHQAIWEDGTSAILYSGIKEEAGCQLD